MSGTHDWTRVRTLFQAALERPVHAREAYLRSVCPDDDELRNEVRSLLKADDAAGSFLETPAVRLATTTPLTLQADDRLGRFRIVAALGAGGMGEVYRAVDSQLDREVAIKILPPVLASDEQRLARFERESRVLASLNHPNIATIHSVEHVDGLHLLVLELVEGPTLAERLAAGPMPWREALAVARELAGALEAAHERGIVHRDLKPANVKLSSTASVKLLDFGLAKAHPAPDSSLASSSPSGSQTVAGVILGTCAYMSPEQTRGQAVDKRTDIWAFGGVLFELVTGKPAFTGETASDTMAAVLERSPDWSLLPTALPESVGRLLRRCLERDPARRLHDIADARLEIDEALRGESDVPGRSRTTATSRWLALAAAIAVVAIGAALIAWRDRLTSASPASGMTPARFTWSLPPTERFESPPVVSPDGRAIAFSASAGDGPPRLFVRELEAVDARPIARTEGARQPFWSPDGRSIAYFARGRLLRVAVDGGAPVDICAAFDPRGGAWGASGMIVFSPAGIFSGLLRVAASGGLPQPVTELDAARGDNSHRWPSFLPDGVHFLYFVRSVAAEHRGVYLGRIDGSPSAGASPLFRSETEAMYVSLDANRGGVLSVGESHIDFRPFDPRRMVLTGDPISLPLPAGGNSPHHASTFSVSSDVLAAIAAPLPYGQRLASVGLAGEDLRVDQTRGVINWPRLSPDGSRLVIQRLDSLTGNPDLIVEDLERRTLVRLTRAGTSGQLPVWSPDGRLIAFVAGPTRQPVVTIAAADGTGSVFTPPCPGRRCEPSDWTRNGQWLVVSRIDSDGTDVWLLPTREGDKPRALLSEPFVERDARLSPDGELVAYVSEETGSPEISIQTVGAIKQREVVSAGGGSQPVWSRDGRALFFVDPKGLLRRVGVSRAANGRPVLAKAELLRVPALGTGHFSTQYDVSPSGRLYFLDRRVEESSREIGVIIRWQALLRNRP